MGKIGPQQLSPLLLAEIKKDIMDDIQTSLPSGGGSISVGDTPPTTSTQGTVWMETGENLGEYENMPIYEGGSLFVTNALIMEDTIPEDYDPNNDILFDID